MCAVRYVDHAVVTLARGGRDSNNPSSCTCLKSYRYIKRPRCTHDSINP